MTILGLGVVFIMVGSAVLLASVILKRLPRPEGGQLGDLVQVAVFLGSLVTTVVLYFAFLFGAAWLFRR